MTKIKQTGRKYVKEVTEKSQWNVKREKTKSFGKRREVEETSFIYSLFLSSCAFLTMASLECGSETGSPLYGGSRVPCSISVHSFMNPVCGVWELKLICKYDTKYYILCCISYSPYFHIMLIFNMQHAITCTVFWNYRGADKSLARTTSPNIFCLMVRIFRLMLVLFYIYIYIYIYIYF
jgi:hypothetical protein